MPSFCILRPVSFPTPHTALATARELTLNIVHGTLGAAVLLIVVVCGSVICKPDKYGLTTMLKFSDCLLFTYNTIVGRFCLGILCVCASSDA